LLRHRESACGNADDGAFATTVAAATSTERIRVLRRVIRRVGCRGVAVAAAHSCEADVGNSAKATRGNEADAYTHEASCRDARHGGATLTPAVIATA
jgi:hypothetical protein